MGRQKGVMPITGSVGNLNFYKRRDGYFVRLKGGPSREQIMSLPSFQSTRETFTDFSKASKLGRLLRHGFGSAAGNAKDGRTCNRLTKALLQILQTDAHEGRGSRSFLNAQLHLLQGFEWKEKHLFSAAFGHALTTTVFDEEVVMEVPELSPERVIRAPEGATHYLITAATVAVDLEQYVVLGIEDGQTDYLPLAAEKQKGCVLRLGIRREYSCFTGVGIHFFQLAGQEFVPLKEGNAFRIEAVKGIPLKPKGTG